MSALANDLFLRALRREEVPRTPVWMMRQAGRYLPEYRATRARAGDFLTLCKTPELACEVTLQPIERFGFDAAILFSDILTVPDAMGLGLSLEEGVGPRFARPVRSRAEVERLGAPDVEGELGYVLDAVRLIKRELSGRVPLIGFAGSPWTLATYAVEAATTREFSRVKGLVYDDPDTAHRLLALLSESVTAYLKGQIRAGADAVMIFDTWGGVLPPRAYAEFSLRYMREVVEAVGDEGAPVILFTKGGGQWLEAIADTGCHALGVDWTTGLDEARRRVGDRVALQGNMDPTVLFSRPRRVRELVARVLEDFGPGPGHVFNLGHGIMPATPPESVAAMVAAVRELSPRYHRAGDAA